jgi:hypothetical protein
LKSIIKNKFNNLNKYYLEYNGKIIHKEDRSLEFYGIKNNAIINVHQKLKGGIDGLQILLIIFCILFVFIFVPLLLVSGLIPFILHISECMIIKFFKGLFSIMETLPRIKGMLGIFRFIVKTGILVFKSVFLYFGIQTIFTLTFFAWTTIMKGGKNLFVKTDKYCKEIDTLSLMSKIGTIVYLVVYGFFRFPNILVSSFGSLLKLGDKYKFGFILTPFYTLYTNLQNFVYDKKWSSLYAIPTVGQFIEIAFEAIDVAFTFIDIYTAKVANFGCMAQSLGSFKKVKNSFINGLQLKKLGLDKNNIDSVKNQSNIKSKDDYNLDKLKSVNNKVSDKFKNISSITSTLKNYAKTNLSKMNLDNKVCCNDEFFDVLKKDMTVLINGLVQTGTIKEFEEYGVTEQMLRFISDAFDTKLIEESKKKFKDSFFIFKYKNDNIKGLIGLFLRTIMCNIMNISQYTNDVLLKVGTPQDIGDTIKCGLFSGQVSLFFYYFSLIYIPMTMTNFKWYINLILSLLIFILCLIIKSQIPFFPVPLMV